jgi:hypothetical protein
VVVNREGKEIPVRGKVGDNLLYLCHRYDIEMEGTCGASISSVLVGAPICKGMGGMANSIAALHMFETISAQKEADFAHTVVTENVGRHATQKKPFLAQGRVRRRWRARLAIATSTRNTLTCCPSLKRKKRYLYIHIHIHHTWLPIYWCP